MTCSQSNGAAFGAALGRHLLSRLNGAEDLDAFDWRGAASEMARELREAEDSLRRSGAAEADVRSFSDEAGQEITKAFDSFRSGLTTISGEKWN